ncbi:hypothetical protein DMUE_6155, partial [Dictyocoela muelleri]
LIVKFLKKNNLLKFYNIDNNFKMFVKYLLILAYVPEKSIEIEFEKIKKLKKDIFYYDQFLEYFSVNFIYGERVGFMNCKNIWSVYERILLNVPTTTNSCEAYHRHLNSKLERKNQCIHKVIDVIKCEERRIRQKWKI